MTFARGDCFCFFKTTIHPGRIKSKDRKSYYIVVILSHQANELGICENVEDDDALLLSSIANHKTTNWKYQKTCRWCTLHSVPITRKTGDTSTKWFITTLPLKVAHQTFLILGRNERRWTKRRSNSTANCNPLKWGLLAAPFKARDRRRKNIYANCCCVLLMLLTSWSSCTYLALRGFSSSLQVWPSICQILWLCPYSHRSFSLAINVISTFGGAVASFGRQCVWFSC